MISSGMKFGVMYMFFNKFLYILLSNEVLLYDIEHCLSMILAIIACKQARYTLAGQI